MIAFGRFPIEAIMWWRQPLRRQPFSLCRREIRPIGSLRRKCLAQPINTYRKSSKRALAACLDTARNAWIIHHRPIGGTAVPARAGSWLICWQFVLQPKDLGLRQTSKVRNSLKPKVAFGQQAHGVRDGVRRRWCFSRLWGRRNDIWSCACSPFHVGLFPLRAARRKRCVVRDGNASCSGPIAASNVSARCEVRSVMKIDGKPLQRAVRNCCNVRSGTLRGACQRPPRYTPSKEGDIPHPAHHTRLRGSAWRYALAVKTMRVARHEPEAAE